MQNDINIVSFTSGENTAGLIKVKEQIKNEINKYLSENRFNYIIKSDNLSTAKKDNADINKTAKALKEVAKKIIDREMQDVNKFKDDLKEYLGMLEEKRLKRVSEIEVFENETRETIKTLLEEYAQKLIANCLLREEFNSVVIGDLIKLTSISKSGTLTKAAKEGVEAKIQRCLSLQNRYDLRVSNLKVVCYEKGLEVPLTENYVQCVVYIDDEAEYQAKLNRMIENEVERLTQIKEEIEAKAKYRAEAEVGQKLKDELSDKYSPLIDNENDVDKLQDMLKELEQYDISLSYNLSKKIDDKINFITKSQEDAVSVKTSKSNKGKRIVSIRVDLQFLVKGNVPDAKILNKVSKKLKKTEFAKRIKSINIVN